MLVYTKIMLSKEIELWRTRVVVFFDFLNELNIQISKKNVKKHVYLLIYNSIC